MFATIAGHLNLLDIALIVILVLVFPAIRLLNSRKPEPENPRPMAQRYLRTIATLGVPLLVLVLDWLATGRGAAALGLAIPLPFRGRIGLAIASVLVLGMTISPLLPWLKSSPEKRAAQQARLKARGLVPETSREAALFLIVAVLIGCGAEILYRAFLLWAFTPFAGVAGAVVIAALAYGIGHGFEKWREAAGAVVSAFVFTAAYALTGSLWWLMAIHSFVALYAAWSGYRFAHAKPA